MRNRHVLVTDVHRAGTTWDGQRLAHHPSLAYIHEPLNVSDPNRAFGYRFNTVFYYVPGSAHEARIHAAFDRLLRSIFPLCRFAIHKWQGPGLDLTLPWRFGKYLHPRRACGVHDQRYEWQAVLGSPSHRRASRTLIRSTAMCWRMAECHMTRRTQLYTMAQTVHSFSTPGTVLPCNPSIRLVVLRCASGTVARP
jgi:hypothetical protein